MSRLASSPIASTSTLSMYEEMLEVIDHELDEVVSLAKTGRDVHRLMLRYDIFGAPCVCAVCGRVVEGAFVEGPDCDPCLICSLLPDEEGDLCICPPCMRAICSGCQYFERCLGRGALMVFCKDVERWVKRAEELANAQRRVPHQHPLHK